jgi:hypothetical protein
MEKEEFKKCELCGKDLKTLEYDSPLYCDKCMQEMEKKSLSPEQMKML